jgi:hypothetical protein
MSAPPPDTPWLRPGTRWYRPVAGGRPLYRLRVSTIVEFRGTFRLVEADMDRLRHLSKGTWYCRCGELADVEHNAPQCDICSAGSNCGLDCTVSRLSCAKCGATA